METDFKPSYYIKCKPFLSKPNCPLFVPHRLPLPDTAAHIGRVSVIGQGYQSTKGLGVAKVLRDKLQVCESAATNSYATPAIVVTRIPGSFMWRITRSGSIWDTPNLTYLLVHWRPAFAQTQSLASRIPFSLVQVCLPAGSPQCAPFFEAKPRPAMTKEEGENFSTRCQDTNMEINHVNLLRGR